MPDGIRDISNTENQHNEKATSCFTDSSFSFFWQTAEEYFNRAISKYDLKDNYGAIADYTKAIELDPDYTAAYSNR